MRIAATRSFRIYRLEGSNPKFKAFFERFESRSTEVDRGRTVFGPFLDTQKLAEAQNRTKKQMFPVLSSDMPRSA